MTEVLKIVKLVQSKWQGKCLALFKVFLDPLSSQSLTSKISSNYSFNASSLLRLVYCKSL